MKRSVTLLALSLALTGAAHAATNTEILWDSWGVPHVYAPDEEAMFRAYGRAQMRAHGDLILKLYGEARGRASEYWGAKYLESDTLVKTVGIDTLGWSWYAQQPPSFKRKIDAFVRGINDFARERPDLISPQFRQVLPVSGKDVFAHNARQFFLFLTSTGDVATRVLNTDTAFLPGSNGWAISPSRSASGNALLLANPHLPWKDLYTFFEAHLNAPGYSMYGASLVGLPVLTYGFSNRQGWAHTVNTVDAFDAYLLEPRGAGYLLDGQIHTYRSKTVTLKVKQPDGTLHDQPLNVRWSVHGPIVGERDGKPIAIRVASITHASSGGALKQWWDMSTARDLTAFQNALRAEQLPMFNTVYADADGHTLLRFGGRCPSVPASWRVGWASSRAARAAISGRPSIHSRTCRCSSTRTAAGFRTPTKRPG